jgi:chromosome segregation ATPase
MAKLYYTVEGYMKNFTAALHMRKYINILFLLSASFMLISCSSAKNDPLISSDDDNEKTYVFSEDGTEWKVKIQDGKITELSKDDELIPQKDIPKYEKKIHSKIEHFENDMAEFKENMNLFHNDMDAYKKEMSEVKQEMNRNHFTFNFDSEQMNSDMEKAAKEMQLVFASADFKESMKELQTNLQNIKVNINMDDVNKQVEEASRQMQNINIDIDMSEVNDNLADLRAELKDKKSQLKSARSGLNRFSSFMDDLKSELKDDGVINDEDDDIDMTFNSKEMIIEGERVPENLHSKYKKMFEERFGRMDDNMSIKTNE